jgi:hypothetical protein
MAEVFSSDNSVAQEVMDSHEAELADSLRVGEELEAAHEQRLAGKYRNTEELEAAYLELQKKLGSQDDEEVEYEEDGEEFDDGGLYGILNAYRETGEITDEAIEAINNMSPADVFALMADQEAGAQGREMSGEEISAVYQAVGGEQEYGALTSWASENLSDNEIDTYDAMIESGDMGQISFALQALYYRYTEAMGQDGNMLQGKPAEAQGGFRSQAELVAAMNDSRYESDPAYRQDVINKLERSDLNF